MKLTLLVIGLSWALTAYGENMKLSAEAEECFAWFKTLGYPDIKNAPLAKTWVARWTQAAGTTDKQDFYAGFVVEEKENEFRVLGEDLTSGTMTKTLKIGPSARLTGYDVLHFRDYAAQVVKKLKESPKGSYYETRYPSFRSRLDFKAALFFLAFACHEKGEDALSQALFDEAAKRSAPHYVDSPNLPPQKKRTASSPPPDEKQQARDMRPYLEEELGHQALWKGIVLIGGGNLGLNDWGNRDEPLLPRSELLAYFREVARLYPHSGEIGRIKKTEAMLERMVAEDEGHPKLSDEEIAKLPVEAQVAEWIFRLRDQNGHQTGQPGWCEIFEDWGMRKKGFTPAHHLAEIGFPAVPQLIKALDDDHFSGSVGFGRDFFFSHSVLTVGDCAASVLSRISCQAIYISSTMSTEGQQAQAKQTASTWWAEIQKQGEEKYLTDAIASGTKHPYEMVEQLKAQHPEAVEKALLAGAPKAKEIMAANGFILCLSELSSPAAMEGLVQMMKEGTPLATRVTAARELWFRHHPAVIPAMIAEWQQRKPVAQPSFENSELLMLLIGSGDTEALSAVISDWDKQPLEDRSHILRSLTSLKDGNAPIIGYDQKPVPLDAKGREMIERFLVHELEDTVVSENEGGSIGDYEYGNPRLCEFALLALYRLAPQRYVFSAKATPQERDVERITAANQWRKSHQEPELLLPTSRSSN